MKRSYFINLTMLFVVLVLSSGMISGNALAQGRNNENRGDSSWINLLPKEELSEFEESSLKYLREEEKLARDVYLALFDEWDSQIFSRIAASEQQHTDMIAQLLKKYEQDDPMQTEAGVFTNPDLQKLYNDLVAAGKVSLVEAYRVGATIEDVDIYDLAEALAEIDNEDIRTVYQNLKKGSRNHLRSFYSALLQNGVTYEARYISAEELEAIVTTPRERGRVDADGNPVNNGRRGRGRAKGNGSGQGYGNQQNSEYENQSQIRLGNYPNPANPGTRIVYILPDAAAVKLAIYNLRGQLVRSYERGQQQAGNHEITWDGRDLTGSLVTSGTYFYRLTAGNQSVTKRLMLVK